MGERQEYLLGDFVEFRNGVNFSREQEGPGIPILKVKDFAALHSVPLNDLDELDPERIKVSPAQFLEPNDIVVIRSNGNRELVGRSLIYKGEPNKVIFSGFCIRARTTNQVALADFLHYWLRSPTTRQTFAREGTGTGINNLSQRLLSGLKIELPPRSEQEGIAALLGTLDAKIDLNRRMNETLEAMARAIFKDWFVDFGPTRAKAEGRAPYLPPELWNLFPDALDNEGKPASWANVPVRNFVSLAQNGGTPPRKNPEFWLNGNVNWFKTGELNDEYLLSSDECITEIGLTKIGKKLWPAGTILFAIYASPTVGRMGILTEHASANQASTALVPVDEVGTPFLFEALYACRSELQNIAVGAAQQNISQKVLLERVIIHPGSELTRTYSAFVQPLFEGILRNSRESATLETLRDFLLPKLMSGEIRLRDAEKAVEAVA